MKRIHLLRTERGAEALAGLIAAARERGLRIGWLDLVAPVPATALDAMVQAGALRAVSVESGRTVALKRPTGPPVLRDLLREHFLGCALVLVRAGGDGAGSAGLASEVGDLPLLEAADGDWRIIRDPAPPLTVGTEELVARLRRPRPWGDARDSADGPSADGAVD